MNCPHCLVEEEVDPVLYQQLGIAPDEKFYHGAGCPSCNYSGYHGRTIVYELLPVSREIANLIRKSPDVQEIKNCAVNQGMTTLTENALALARERKTSLEEVYATRLD
jgi:type II secretory ATPase GspE/PulE/Tfp pilus assembly ATPase PilB-like protein